MSQSAESGKDNQSYREGKIVSTVAVQKVVPFNFVAINLSCLKMGKKHKQGQF